MLQCSPRSRGGVTDGNPLSEYVFPARAGVDRARGANSVEGVRFPRASGGGSFYSNVLSQEICVSPARAGVRRRAKMLSGWRRFPRASAGVSRKGRENKSGKLLSLRLQG